MFLWILTSTSLLPWCDLADIIEQHYTEVARPANFQANRAQIEIRLFDLANEELQYVFDAKDDPQTNESEGRRLEQVAEIISGLDRTGTRDNIVSELLGLSEAYKDNGLRIEEPDYEPDEVESRRDDFDINSLFEDL